MMSVCTIEDRRCVVQAHLEPFVLQSVVERCENGERVPPGTW